MWIGWEGAAFNLQASQLAGISSISIHTIATGKTAESRVNCVMVMWIAYVERLRIALQTADRTSFPAWKANGWIRPDSELPQAIQWTRC